MKSLSNLSGFIRAVRPVNHYECSLYIGAFDSKWYLQFNQNYKQMTTRYLC